MPPDYFASNSVTPILCSSHLVSYLQKRIKALKALARPSKMSITKLYHISPETAMSILSKMDVKEALRIANESDTDSPEAERVLTLELDRIWTRIQNQPDSYTMNQTEFSVFNRYRAQPRLKNETARLAIARYWNSIRAGNSH